MEGAPPLSAAEEAGAAGAADGATVVASVRRQSFREGEATVCAAALGLPARDVSEPSDDLYSELLYRYGFKSLEQSGSAERIPVVEALGGKIVALLFTSVAAADPEVGDSTFLEMLKKLVTKYARNLAVVFVSMGDGETEVEEFLADKPEFFGVAQEDAATRATLAEQFGVYAMFNPTLVIISPQGLHITSWGRSAVMYNPEYAVIEWKNGRSGLRVGRYLAAKVFGI